MFVLVSFLFWCSCVNGEVWQKAEDVLHTDKMKECFYYEHAALVRALFPSRSMEREKREAIVIDYLARLILKGESRFCDSLYATLVSATYYLERRADFNTTWQTTLEQFKQNSERSLDQCISLRSHFLDYIDMQSERVRCMNETLYDTKYASMIAHYVNNERGVYQ